MAATVFTSPSITNTMAIIQLTRVALTGSACSPFPLDKKLLSLFEGNETSLPKACKVRGATNMEPIAEERVDAPRPNGTIIAPPKAI